MMKKALCLALGYQLLVFVSLYFTPFLTQFLMENNLLKIFIDTFHLLFGIGLVLLFFHKYQIQSAKAYLLFGLLLVGFLTLFFNARYLVERFHYMEYALGFALWFRVFRHKWGGGLCYFLTFCFMALLGILDEGVQWFLPNRHFEWADVRINLIGSLIGVGVVLLLMFYRRDKKNINIVGLSASITQLLLVFCLLSSVFCLSGPAFAAPLNVDLVDENDVAVYDAIDQLTAFGLIDTLNKGQRPWSRNEVARMIREAKKNLERIHDVPVEIQARQSLKFLSKRYKSELDDVSEIAFYPIKEVSFEYLYFDSPSREVPINVGTGDEIRAVINPLIAYRKGRSYQDTNNFGIETTSELDLTKYFAVWAAPNFLFRTREDTQDYVQIGFDDLYGMTEFSNIGFQLGRDVVAWGQARYGGIVNSTNATPLDMLKISNVSPFEYPWIFKFLGPSSVGFYFGIMEANRIFPRDYITGLKVTFQPSRNVEFGLSGELMSGGRGSPSAPFGKRVEDFFGVFATLFNDDPAISNRLGGIDFLLRIPKWRGLELYYEFLLEDTQSITHWNTMFIDYAMHQVGIFMPRFNDVGTQNLRFEFVYAGFRPYRHHQFKSGWTRNSRILGNEMGPDSIGAVLTFESRPTYHFVQTHQFAVENRGSDLYSLLNDATVVRVVQHNPSETRYRWMSAFTLESKPQVDWTLGFGYERIQQFNFISGSNRNNFLVNLRLNIYPKGKVAKKN